MRTGLGRQSVQSQQGVNLRQALLAEVKQQIMKVNTLVGRLQSAESLEPEQCLQVAEELVATADEVIKAGDWQSSLFLRNTIKPIVKIREQALELIASLQANTELDEVAAPNINSAEQIIYISLFQNQGFDMRCWEMQLRCLHKYMLGRPVYAEHDDAEKVIRMHSARAREAYVAVAVDQANVQVNASRQDKYGNQILTISDGAVKPERILEFVHLDRHYIFSKGKLILKDR